MNNEYDIRAAADKAIAPPVPDTPDYIGIVIVDGSVVKTVSGDDWAEVGILLREVSKPFGDTAVTEVYTKL